MAEPSDAAAAAMANRRRRRDLGEEERPQNTSSTVHQPLPKFLKHEEEGIDVDPIAAIRRFPTSSIVRWSTSNSSSERKGVVAVVGVGPGLGYSIAQRFVHEGYTVAILARNSARLEKFVKEIAEKETNALLYAIRIDCSDPNEVKQAFESMRSFGLVELLVYNVSTPASRPATKFSDIDPESFRQTLMLPCLGAFYCVQQVLPSMVEKRRGTILFTGSSSSVKGLAGTAETACGKFALRALSQCLAQEYQPHGIHVAHIIVDGTISSKRNLDADDDPTMMSPDAIAEAYWNLHMQDRGAWTHELDLRSSHHQF